MRTKSLPLATLAVIAALQRSSSVAQALNAPVEKLKHTERSSRKGAVHRGATTFDENIPP